MSNIDAEHLNEIEPFTDLTDREKAQLAQHHIEQTIMGENGAVCEALKDMLAGDWAISAIRFREIAEKLETMIGKELDRMAESAK